MANSTTQLHPPSETKTLWAWTLGTFFGAGLLKPGPGTYGSIAAVLLWYAAAHILHPSPIALATGTTIAAIIATLIGIPAATIVARESGREDPGRARFEVLVHGDTAIQRETGSLRKGCHRRDANPDHDEIGIQRRASAEHDRAAVNAVHRLAQVEHDALCFVQRLNEPTDGPAHHALQRGRLRRDDVDCQATSAQ